MHRCFNRYRAVPEKNILWNNNSNKAGVCPNFSKSHLKKEKLRILRIKLVQNFQMPRNFRQDPVNIKL